MSVGDCFGELGLLCNEHRTTSIMVSADAYLMKITTSDLDKMSNTLQVQFYKAVSHLLVTRLLDHEAAADKAA